MVADIKLVGEYMLENQPELNMNISEGMYKGKKVLDVMVACTENDIVHFFSYIIVRPDKYAGQEWKISEIFATWVHEGAPVPQD
jgi:ABC-type tungstate transport system permease subunit